MFQYKAMEPILQLVLCVNQNHVHVRLGFTAVLERVKEIDRLSYVASSAEHVPIDVTGLVLCHCPALQVLAFEFIPSPSILL